MKAIKLLLPIIILLFLTSCTKKYVPVENESGFTVENVELIDQLGGSKDLYFDGEIAFSTNYHIWLYKLNSDNEDEYNYAVALEMTIKPEKDEIEYFKFSIEVKEDINYVQIEDVQIEYEESIKPSSYYNYYELNDSKI